MLKVLVVDDEVFVRKGIVLETDWAALGFEVAAEAKNGLEGLDAVHKYNPDLIICDIRMPKMGGIEMLKALREEGNRVHVIFLTAYGEFEYAKEALKLYAFDYILKPFEDGELEEAVLRAKKEIESRREEASRRETESHKETESRGNMESREEKDSRKDESALLALDVKPEEKSGYIREALQFIADHYQENEMNVGAIAGFLGISEGHLSHLFKKETNYTVMAYLTRYRMRAAMKLLSDCRSRVYEVAEQVGYKDIAYFSSTFKKIVGMTPSEYQDRNA